MYTIIQVTEPLYARVTMHCSDAILATILQSNIDFISIAKNNNEDQEIEIGALKCRTINRTDRID